MDLGLKGKTVIVTGGAKGIGSGISRVFAQEGANVVINYRSQPAQCEAFAQQIAQQTGAQTIAVQADVGLEAEVAHLFEAAIDAFGQVDILVNNAGISPTIPIWEMELSQWEEIQRTNLTSMFLTSRAMVRHLLSRKAPGSIVNISSKAGVSSTTHGRVGYNSSKAGVIGLTKALARDVTQYGIRVNAVLPGFVRNKFTEMRLREQPEFMAERMRRVPIGRLGEPEDMGHMVAMLASEQSMFAIGSIVDMTGGLLL